MPRKTHFWTREFYKPRNASRVAFKDHPGDEAFWVRTVRGKYHVVGFHGKAQKPFFNVLFGTYDRMVTYVTNTYATLHARKAEHAREREVLRTVEHTVKVGDIFSSSWGYEQTNVYFYQVIELRGARTAVLRRIAGERNYTGPMQGTMVAVKDAFLERSDPITKRILVQDKSGRAHFKIESYEYAYPWDGEPRNFTEWH